MNMINKKAVSKGCSLSIKHKSQGVLNTTFLFFTALITSILLSSQTVLAQQTLFTNNHHPDMMPELSVRGKYDVGVSTAEITNARYIDPMSGNTAPRSLTIEVWYPSVSDESDTAAVYSDELRSGKTFSILADANRNSKFDDTQQWPLVVLSHGYTGYRTIMYYLGEHLASHGYVVVGIDHTDSTNAEIDFANGPFAGFMSTLLNRSRDQQFVLSYLADNNNVKVALNQKVSWTANKAGLIGYSMGGYGALSTVGGCYDFPDALVSNFIQSQDANAIKGMQTVLNTCSAGQTPSADKPAETDPRWQAMMAFAPWGGQHKLFEYESVSKITVPSMLVSGDLDDVSIYPGIQDIFKQFSANDHYLLTYMNARHNIAPHPAPVEAWTEEIDFGHYFEPAWSSERLNHINMHFALAMMNCYVKDKPEYCEFLAVKGDSNQEQAAPGLAEPWKGFDNRYSTGMNMISGKAK